MANKLNARNDAPSPSSVPRAIPSAPIPSSVPFAMLATRKTLANAPCIQRSSGRVLSSMLRTRSSSAPLGRAPLRRAQRSRTLTNEAGTRNATSTHNAINGANARKARSARSMRKTRSAHDERLARVRRRCPKQRRRTRIL